MAALGGQQSGRRFELGAGGSGLHGWVPGDDLALIRAAATGRSQPAGHDTPNEASPWRPAYGSRLMLHTLHVCQRSMR